MGNRVIVPLLAALLLVGSAVFVAAPAQAGDEMICKACNLTIIPPGAHGCVFQKIVQTFSYKIMGPALKSDGKKNSLKLVYKAQYVYVDHDCTERLDWCCYTTKGCAGAVWQQGWPESVEPL